ncbi:MAG TPA: ATP-binding protein [Usitatibacter sp.]|nr:ATP-binding protein [Usitatibacter sp.]
MKARSLLWQLLAVVLVALVLAEVSAAFLLQAYVTRPDSINRVAAFVTHLKTIGSALRVMPASEEVQFLREVAERNGIRMLPVQGQDGMQVAPRAGPIVALLRERLHAELGSDTDVYLRHGDPDQLWVRLPMHGETDYWVGFPRRRVQQDLNTAFVAWTAVVVALSFLAAYLIMRGIGSPLRRVASVAEGVARGEDPPPLEETGPREFRSVAREFNRMREALRKAERDRATFLAGISHDLRTPLGHLRLDLEMARERVDPEMHREMMADLEDMRAILDQFIDFAGTEADEAPSPVSLAELAAACAERVERDAQHVRLELADVPALMLRPIALQRLATNLLNNAIRHGAGDITVRCVAYPREVQLSVLDRGPGIPEASLQRVKEPFRRADDGRGGAAGAGLGLAIAERIARLHGGRLDLLGRDGGGLEARLTLPRGDPAGALTSG